MADATNNSNSDQPNPDSPSDDPKDAEAGEDTSIALSFKANFARIIAHGSLAVSNGEGGRSFSGFLRAIEAEFAQAVASDIEVAEVYSRPRVAKVAKVAHTQKVAL